MEMQGFFGKECESEALALEYNKSVVKAEAAFEYDYYSLPEVQGSEVQGKGNGNVEVRVQASFSSSGASYWVARPELLLLKVASSCNIRTPAPATMMRCTSVFQHQCFSLFAKRDICCGACHDCSSVALCLVVHHVLMTVCTSSTTSK